MKSSLIRGAVCGAVVTLLLVGALAYAPSPAAAETPVLGDLALQVRWLRVQVVQLGRIVASQSAAWTDSVAALRSVDASLSRRLRTLDDAYGVLTGRLTAMETSQAATDARLDALEQDAAAEFWPLEVSVEPVVHAAWDRWDPYMNGATSGLGVSLNVIGTDRSTGDTTSVSPDNACIKLTMQGTTVWNPSSSQNIGAPEDTPETIPSGTPITVEYWVDAYGQRLHGTQVMTDWAWFYSGY